MPRTVGFMLTWTTYGSWLQGDPRGYVKDSQVLPCDKKLVYLCGKLQKTGTTKLRKDEKDIVSKAIFNEAKRIGMSIEALAVCNNHVHLVARFFLEPIGQIVSRFKNVTSYALRKHGRTGRIWTRGFDKRFCFSNEDLSRRVRYVKNHNR